MQQKEKYGFVYIWYDRKHKRYYIGCHWGREDDGYICSSSWVHKIYKRRPHDLKRRILSLVFTNRQDLLQEEFRWLDMIKDEELNGVRYYNKYKHHFGHWSNEENRKKEIANKISKKNKGKRVSPETEIKLGERRSPNTEFKKGQQAHNQGQSLEEQYGNRSSDIREKMSQAKKGKRLSPSTEFKKGMTTWNKDRKFIWITNGIEDKSLYYETEYMIPEGWKRGRSKIGKRVNT